MELFVFVCEKLLLESPCGTECPHGYFLYNGLCYSYDCYRVCNGKLIPFDDFCNRCQPEYVNISDKCVHQSNVWVSDGQQILLETPCGSSCSIGRFLHEGVCSDQFWNCNGLHQPIENSCDGKCFSFSFSLDNGKCKVVSKNSWTCGEECNQVQKKEIPCNGLCPVGFVKEGSRCFPFQWEYERGNLIIYFLFFCKPSNGQKIKRLS